MEEEHSYLVFMDMQMSEMDELETTKPIREKERVSREKAVIIAMVAYAIEGDRQMCLDAGLYRQTSGGERTRKSQSEETAAQEKKIVSWLHR